MSTVKHRPVVDDLVKIFVSILGNTNDDASGRGANKRSSNAATVSDVIFAVAMIYFYFIAASLINHDAEIFQEHHHQKNDRIIPLLYISQKAKELSEKKFKITVCSENYFKGAK
ncbi:unnamed protein product [Clavelina lepadiformis]|uniref:Uncharacterized protein n=1 Tax=Clavelina lepadiformis TaxID=159417 RepID=A0ABP0G7Y0_CLALP